MPVASATTADTPGTCSIAPAPDEPPDEVELAPGGEVSRALPFLRNGRSGYYIQQNRGKKSIAVNRKDPRAIELVKKVLAHCDVLVENFAPGVTERLGFGWATVHALNPRLVMGSISAFDQSGPLSKLPGYDYHEFVVADPQTESEPGSTFATSKIPALSITAFWIRSIGIRSRPATNAPAVLRDYSSTKPS